MFDIFGIGRRRAERERKKKEKEENEAQNAIRQRQEEANLAQIEQARLRSDDLAAHSRQKSAAEFWRRTAESGQEIKSQPDLTAQLTSKKSTLRP